MTTFSDSDEITNNPLIDDQSSEDDIDPVDLEGMLGEEADEGQDGTDEVIGSRRIIQSLIEEIEELADEEQVALNGEKKVLEREISKDEEELAKAKDELEDEVAGFVDTE